MVVGLAIFEPLRCVVRPFASLVGRWVYGGAMDVDVRWPWMCEVWSGVVSGAES